MPESTPDGRAAHVLWPSPWARLLRPGLPCLLHGLLHGLLLTALEGRLPAAWLLPAASLLGDDSGG